VREKKDMLVPARGSTRGGRHDSRNNGRAADISRFGDQMHTSEPLHLSFHRPPAHFVPCLSSALTSLQFSYKMVLLVTSDNEQFVVDKEVAERSVLIKNMLEGELRLPHIPDISNTA
jgi:hypothetical protein